MESVGTPRGDVRETGRIKTGRRRESQRGDTRSTTETLVQFVGKWNYFQWIVNDFRLDLESFPSPTDVDYIARDGQYTSKGKGKDTNTGKGKDSKSDKHDQECAMCGKKDISNETACQEKGTTARENSERSGCDDEGSR